MSNTSKAWIRPQVRMIYLTSAKLTNSVVIGDQLKTTNTYIRFFFKYLLAYLKYTNHERRNFP